MGYAQIHELKKDGDAEKHVRAAFDGAAMSPAEKTIHVFVACGGDATVNAGTHMDPSRSMCLACKHKMVSCALEE